MANINLTSLTVNECKSRLNRIDRHTNLARPDISSAARNDRSEEHTSELQSPDHLVCRLLLEKKKNPELFRPLAPQQPTSFVGYSAQHHQGHVYVARLADFRDRVEHVLVLQSVEDDRAHEQFG